MNDFLDKSFTTLSRELNESKSTRTIKKIRKQAKKGKADFELNKAQLNFLRELEKKYGKEARKELQDFRNEVLSVFHFVQKKTRESGLVTTKDLMGVTKKEWERAVESGKNKIKKRGEIADKITSDIRAINHNRRSITKLDTIKRMLSGKRDLDTNLVRSEIDKFIKNYNFISGGKIDNLKQVQQYTNDIERSWKAMEQEISKDEKVNLDLISKEAEKILDKQYNYQKSSSSDDKEYDESLSKAAVDYFLRQNIVNNIMSSGDNVFKSFYYTFLNKLTNDAKKRINTHMDNLRKRGEGLRFNEIEDKVWGLKKNASSKSGDLSDYYLKIEEEDFEDRNEPKNIEQPEPMKRSKKKIENERYNFLQRFKKKYDISEKDYDKIHSLGLMSFIDREHLLKYARDKLGSKMRDSKIKLELEKIIYRSLSEKEAEKAVDKLAGKTINKKDMYEIAYKLFDGDIKRPTIRSIVDNIINKSKTEKEVERRINNAYDSLKEKDTTISDFMKSKLGDDE